MISRSDAQYRLACPSTLTGHGSKALRKPWPNTGPAKQRTTSADDLKIFQEAASFGGLFHFKPRPHRSRIVPRSVTLIGTAPHRLRYSLAAGLGRCLSALVALPSSLDRRREARQRPRICIHRAFTSKHQHTRCDFAVRKSHLKKMQSLVVFSIDFSRPASIIPPRSKKFRQFP
jgi:hypothetical protein